MAYIDIMALVKAQMNKEEDDMRLRASCDYALAQLIGISVNDPKRYPKNLKKAYPGLFGGQDWRDSKEAMSRYVAAHNASLKAGG